MARHRAVEGEPVLPEAEVTLTIRLTPAEAEQIVRDASWRGYGARSTGEYVRDLALGRVKTGGC